MSDLNFVVFEFCDKKKLFGYYFKTSLSIGTLGNTYTVLGNDKTKTSQWPKFDSFGGKGLNKIENKRI